MVITAKTPVKCECTKYHQGMRWVRFIWVHQTGILMAEEYQPHYDTRAAARAAARDLDARYLPEEYPG